MSEQVQVSRVANDACAPNDALVRRRPRVLAAVARAVSGALLTLAFVGAFGGVAEAQDGDGAYERWDSYLALELTAGVLASARDGAWDVGPSAELRARVIDAGGPFVGYAWDDGGRSMLVLGVELRPLWPALFLLDASIGREWLDLFVQSLSVELGVAFLPLGASDPGLAFAWGLALDVPLLLPSRAKGALRGVGLRLQMRRIRVDENALEAPSSDDVWSVGASLRVTFGVGRSLSGGGRWL